MLKNAWRFVVPLVGLLFLVFVVFYLYDRAGLKQFIRAVRFIQSEQTSERRKQSWNIFNNENKDYGGIYAGSLFNKIWIWTGTGLRFYTIDEFSVFFVKDGCIHESIKLIRENDKKGFIYHTVFHKLSDWTSVIHKGDFITVKLTHQNMGGTIGNLREVYAYNFWPFMQQDIQSECAK